MNLEQARHNMIEQQVRTWEVLDQQVLDLLDQIPRERFVPPEYRQLAYADTRIPIGEGQVMMTPRVEARLLQSLRIGPTDTALEIGTGSGYLAALLASLAEHVYSVEISDALSRAAARRMEEQGIENVTLHVADGLRGWIDHEPYDAIAVTGSVPRLDENLERQLAVGGRMFIIVGESPVMEALLITRVSERDWTRESIFETDLPPLLGATKPQTFSF